QTGEHGGQDAPPQEGQNQLENFSVTAAEQGAAAAHRLQGTAVRPVRQAEGGQGVPQGEEQDEQGGGDENHEDHRVEHQKLSHQLSRRGVDGGAHQEQGHQEGYGQGDRHQHQEGPAQGEGQDNQVHHNDPARHAEAAQ